MGKRRLTPPSRRNLAARSTLMRKGGVHEKTRKAERRREKQTLKAQWRGDLPKAA